jgi:RNA polymerase sigma-70 factor (ECF subfamily)
MKCVMMVGSMKNRTNTEQLSLTDDQTALKALYDGYYDRIYAYCVHRLFCRTAAEDVTSQIFLSAARGFKAVAGQEFETHVRWLYGIAANQCNSYIRQHLTRRKIFEKFQAEQSHHQKDIDLQPDWTAVYGAIAQLKPIEQTVITLRFFENMDYDQIAAIINKRQSSVRVVLHRALKKLQKLLNAADCGFIDRGVGHD